MQRARLARVTGAAHCWLDQLHNAAEAFQLDFYFLQL